MVVVAGVRRLAVQKQTLALVQLQRRNGGSLTKNKHVEVRTLRCRWAEGIEEGLKALIHL